MHGTINIKKTLIFIIMDVRTLIYQKMCFTAVRYKAPDLVMVAYCFLRRRMTSLSCPLHYGVKPVVLVGSIFHSPDGAVCLHDTVGTLHHVSISRLPLALDVAGVRVVN